MRLAENNLWGKTTDVLMLNLVVLRETTRSLTALDTYTLIVQCRHKEHALVQLVKALPYRTYSRGFDARWGNCDF